MSTIPALPGTVRKNDALFMYGASRSRPFVLTYEQERVEVVGGPSLRRETEIHIGRCLKDEVPVYERRGGGGTVVLAPGMVITIVVDDRPSGVGATTLFNMIHDSMITLLQEQGIRGVVRCGISDLAIDGRKILGSSLYMGNHPFFYYYQSSLIVDADLGLLDRYLKHPPREPDYRGGRTHRDFCTSLARAGRSISSASIRELFDNRLAGCIISRKKGLPFR
jgi:lipoate---protein ligase